MKTLIITGIVFLASLPVSEKQLSEKDFLQLVKGKILAKASISASFGR